MNTLEHSETSAPEGELMFPPLIRILARIISVIFHPLFIPVYLSWFLIYEYQVFPSFSGGEKILLLVRFAVMYTVFPLVTVLLAKGVGFVQTIYLKNQKDRIVPYIACGLYYFWMWYVLKNQPEIPDALVMLSLAIFLASSLGLILNSYLKISMHTIAVGIASTFIVLLSFISEVNLGFYIAITLFLTGLISTARLINNDHHPAEVYLGLIVGCISQLIAYQFV